MSKKIDVYEFITEDDIVEKAVKNKKVGLKANGRTLKSKKQTDYSTLSSSSENTLMFSAFIQNERKKQEVKSDKNVKKKKRWESVNKYPAVPLVAKKINQIPREQPRPNQKLLSRRSLSAGHEIKPKPRTVIPPSIKPKQTYQKSKNVSLTKKFVIKDSPLNVDHDYRSRNERKLLKGGTNSSNALTIDSSSEEEEEKNQNRLVNQAFSFVGSHKIGKCTVRWPKMDSKTNLSIEIEKANKNRIFISMDEITDVHMCDQLSIPGFGKENGVASVMLKTQVGGAFHKSMEESHSKNLSRSRKISQLSLIDEEDTGQDSYMPDNDDVVLLLFETSNKGAPSFLEVNHLFQSIQQMSMGFNMSLDPECDRLSRAISEVSHENFTSTDSLSPPTSLRRNSRSSTSNSNRDSVLNAIVILQYPPEKTALDPVMITVGDQKRLEPCEYLNDNLVDFYLKFMVLEKQIIPPPKPNRVRRDTTDKPKRIKLRPHKEDEERMNEIFPESRLSAIHIFSSHFFVQLNDRQGVSFKKDGVNHSKVEKWTKNFDIFTKRFVFVPVVEYSHWSLAVICNLDCLLQYWRRRFARSDTEEEEEIVVVTDSLLEGGEDEALEKDEVALVEMTVETEQRLSLTSSESVLLVDAADTAPVVKNPRLSIGSADNAISIDIDDNALNNENNGEDVEEEDIELCSRKKRKNVKVFLEDTNIHTNQVEADEPTVEADELEDRVPCILFMDSLGMHSPRMISAAIRSYLKQEWQKRKSISQQQTHNIKSKEQNKVKSKEEGEERASSNEQDSTLFEDEEFEDFHRFVTEFFFTESREQMQIIKPKVPCQPNGFDCGVYVLQYCEEILLRWPIITQRHLSAEPIPGFSPTMFSAARIEAKRSGMKDLIGDKIDQ